jgi:hypothetical protein
VATNIKITLLRPWVTTKPYFEYGTSDAVPTSKVEDWQQVPRGQQTARYIPGKPFRYPTEGSLVFGDPETESCNVPEEVAIHFFGNWNIVHGAHTAPGDQRFTWGVEQMRVAKVWGDYRFDFSRPSQEVGVHLAEPNMPYVKLQRVNDRGRVDPSWTFYPRDHWQFKDEPEKESPTITLSTANVDTEALFAEFKKRFDAEAASKNKLPEPEPVPVRRGRPKKTVEDHVQA